MLSLQTRQLFAGMFSALAEPNRFHLALYCYKKPRTVTELRLATGLAQTLVSYHLRQLRAGRIVNRQRVGRHALYAVENPFAKKIFDALCRKEDAGGMSASEI